MRPPGAEVDNFPESPLSKYSHDFTHRQTSPCSGFLFGGGGGLVRAFDGEPFDSRDIGGGSKWMFWYV